MKAATTYLLSITVNAVIVFVAHKLLFFLKGLNACYYLLWPRLPNFIASRLRRTACAPVHKAAILFVDGFGKHIIVNFFSKIGDCSLFSTKF